jgi:hypothetical protein
MFIHGNDEGFCDTWRKGLQDFSRCRYLNGSEIEYDEYAIHSIFRNFGISKNLFLKPDDIGERSHLLPILLVNVSAADDSRSFL